MSEDWFEFVYDDRCKEYLDEELARKIYEKLGYDALHDVCRSIEQAYDDGYNNGWSNGYVTGYDSTTAYHKMEPDKMLDAIRVRQ